MKTLNQITKIHPLPLGKQILFSFVATVLVWVFIEVVLHGLTSLGIFPLIPTITPSYYTKDTTKYRFDKHGSPIFVDGHKVYGQIGVPIKPLQLDAEGYRPIDAERFNLPGYKIGFFGDSYTEGLQVDDSETFPRLLANRLKRRGQNAIGFNFGVMGTGTYHQYLRFLTVAERTHLDDVVLCFLPQNDVLNNHERLGADFALPKSPYLVMRHDGFVESHPDADTQQINQRVSRLRVTVGTSFVATGVYRLFRLLTIDAKKRKADIWQRRTSWLGVYGEPPSQDWEAAWGVTEEAVLRFAKAANQRNSRFTVVIVADSLQIADSEVLTPEVVAGCDFEYPNRRLKQFCETYDIVCLDALPFFRKKKHTLEYPYFSWKHDGHYSQLGHQTVTDFLMSTGRFNQPPLNSPRLK